MSSIIQNIFSSYGALESGLKLFANTTNIHAMGAQNTVTFGACNIVFDTVYYRHEEHYFNNISLNIRGGEKVIITGLSGCGKSTFIRMLLKYITFHQELF